MKHPEHDNGLDEIEIHEDKPRGWYIPPPIRRMFEDRILNAEEVLLLTKIDALQDEKYGGCWASNRWLAKWWGKSPLWVSQTVAKFKELKLIKTKFFVKKRKTRRVIKVLFQGDGIHPHSIRKTIPYDKNHIPPYDKNHSKDNTSYYGEKGLRELRSGSNGLISNGKDQSSQLVQRYVEFTIKNRLHVGKTGSTINGWQKSIILGWEKRTRELLQQVEFAHVKKVLDWYFENWRETYTPKCQTMKRFCERFSDVEDAMRRSRNGHSNGETEYDSPAPRITYE